VKPWTRYLPSAALLVIAGLAWQWIVTARHIPSFILPGPVDIAQTAWRLRSLLLTNALPTTEIAVLGFLVALAAGVLLAIAIHLSRVVELALYPLIIASQAIPVLALAPIMLLVLGFTIGPKLIIVALICFFPITVNTVDGLRAVDPDLIRMMRSLGAHRLTILREAELPGALPYLFSGAKVAVTFSVIGALYSEYVGSTEGLGYLMTQLQNQFETGALFGAMALLTAIGVALFAAVTLAERLLIPWHRDERAALYTNRKGYR